jgi:hypothetical protein
MKLSSIASAIFSDARFGQMVEVVEKIKSRLNKVENGRCFYNQYDGKVLNRDVVETINAHFKSEVLKQN